MSLRYRLFLWVSALFVIAAIVGFFLEGIVTHRALEKAKVGLCEKILQSKEEVRKNLEEFLSTQIIENQARIDVLLNTLSYSAPKLVQFAPTAENLEHGTWQDCIDLLEQNRWIDFIQNTNDAVPTAVIVPAAPPFAHAYRVPIDADLCWVFSGVDGQAYMGVRLFAISQEYPPLHIDGEEIQELTPSIPETYLLFPWKKLKEAPALIYDANLSLSPPWIEGHAISLTGFLKAIERARIQLQQGTLEPPAITKEEVRKKQEMEGSWEEQMLSVLPKEQFMHQKINDLSIRNGQVNILWLVLTLMDTGLFKKNPQFPQFVGMSTFKDQLSTGPAAFTQNLFFQNALFNDSEYYKDHAPEGTQENLATSLAIIRAQNLSQVFLGNTAKFAVNTAQEQREGFLTLALDADNILQELAFSMHLTAALVTDGQVWSAFSADGVKYSSGKKSAIDLSKVVHDATGFVTWDGKEYFFMQLTPFPSLDLHVFLFNPVEKEFALLSSLEEGSRQVAQSILFNIHVAGFCILLMALVLLNYFAKSITAPIIQLAGATKNVKEGNLDQIEIAVPKTKSKDEIYTLCESFDEMVKGLKEKEKVKGILNKVVSQEIAEEILTGQIHLGGEEKRVTVLFADIRNFTAMTQKMLPTAVIDLLNSCMTKISLCVDQHRGVIDKYVGDEAMALFGAPVPNKESALDAIKSAIAMIVELKKWNQERSAQGLPSVEMGIGIHAGDVLVGNMGAENRLNYTVIGRNVNLAARICSAAKGMEILISKETLHENSVEQSILYEELPAMTLKGFDTPVILYRVKGLK